MPISAGQVSRSAIGHCRDIFKRHDYETYICTHFLPKNVRLLRWALGALNSETAMIKTVSKTADIAALRMQYWTDALLSVPATEVHYLLFNLHKMG